MRCYHKPDREHLYLLHTEEVLAYLFEPERSSSEPDVDSMETPDTVNTREERIGNTDWY